MEFPGVGVIPYETPPEDLRPYFIRKYKHWFSIFPKDENGLLQRDMLVGEVEEKIKMFPEWKRDEARKKRMRVWDNWMFHGKNSVCETECVNEWIENRIFAQPEDRKRHMEELKEHNQTFFDGIDLNQNGVMEWEEYELSTSILDTDIKRNSFHAVDASKDGVISFEEWAFAAVHYFLCDGPDGPFENFLGPIPEA